MKCSFILICAYYYGLKVIQTVAYTAAVLAIAFMIHKIVSWALWVMSL